MGVIRIDSTDAALYGRDPDGSGKARDAWWGRMGANNPQQSQVTGGMGYANGQAQAERGPQATEDPRLAGNEASGANGHQAGAIGLAGSLASGMQPSQGAYQLQNGLNQASDFQTAMGHSQRGAAAMATAGSNAQANTANLQQNAYLQAGALKANDMTAGRGLYGSLVGTQREQDTARIGQANELGQFNAQANDQYRLGMGNAALGFGQAANGQSGMDLSNYQQGMNPVNAQTQANQQKHSWDSHNSEQAVNNNIQEDA